MTYNLERELMSLQIVRRSEEHSFKNQKREAEESIEQARAELVAAQLECEAAAFQKAEIE